LTTHPVLVHCTRLSSSAAELCGLLVVGLRTLDSDEARPRGQPPLRGDEEFEKRAFSASKAGGCLADRDRLKEAACECDDINLLGLTVHLNQVVLNIVAVTGAGNLLGNLLSAITGLLNGGGPLASIVALLNSLLAILG
jgi:hypothetical protein